jgi:hypothetical protein
MSETPTTVQVRDDWAGKRPGSYVSNLAEFDRWLASVKAEALRDAAEWLDDMQSPEGGYPRDIPLILHGWADQIEEA